MSSHHLPYLKLGRIYAAKGMIKSALDEFRKALEFKRSDALALLAIEHLESKLQ